jgi:hypothetical protein
MKEGDRLLAVFPDIPADGKGNITCYAHVGQHSGASLEYVRELETTMDGIEELKAELESIGYELNVLKQLPPVHQYYVDFGDCLKLMSATCKRRIFESYKEGHKPEKIWRKLPWENLS